MEPKSVEEKPVSPAQAPEDSPENDDRLFHEWGAMIKRDNLTSEGEIIDNDPEDPDTEDKKKQVAKVLDANQVKLAADMIYSTVQGVVDGIFGIPVPDENYKKFSESMAKAICTYYQGGIFEFLTKWQPLLAAIWATIIFAKAVREGVKVKQLEAEKSREKEVGSDDQSQAKAA